MMTDVNSPNGVPGIVATSSQGAGKRTTLISQRQRGQFVVDTYLDSEIGQFAFLVRFEGTLESPL